MSSRKFRYDTAGGLRWDSREKPLRAGKRIFGHPTERVWRGFSNILLRFLTTQVLLPYVLSCFSFSFLSMLPLPPSKKNRKGPRPKLADGNENCGRFSMRKRICDDARFFYYGKPETYVILECVISPIMVISASQVVNLRSINLPFVHSYPSHEVTVST